MQELNLLYLNLALTGVLLIIVLWQLFRFAQLERVRKEFFSSGNKLNLEQILVTQNRALTKINEEIKDLDGSLSNLYKANRNNIQKIGFTRFNPFDDSGGNISFALALLDAKDDGVVISSLHGREGTRVYAKAVKAGVSESKMTEEEVEAIKKAN
jgi:hypothetical protein